MEACIARGSAAPVWPVWLYHSTCLSYIPPTTRGGGQLLQTRVHILGAVELKLCALEIGSALRCLVAAPASVVLQPCYQCIMLALLTALPSTPHCAAGTGYTNFDAQREDPFANYNPPQPTPNLYQQTADHAPVAQDTSAQP